MNEPTENDAVRRGLRSGDVQLARAGRVIAGPGPDEPYVVFDADGRAVEPVSGWARYMAVGDHSPRTIRSYCYAALMWFRVLWQLDVTWDRATEAETAALVGWLRIAPNPQRRRKAGAPEVNLKTGKPNLGVGYGAATINLTLAAVRGFYDFHAHWGRGPVVNPVPESPARRRASLIGARWSLLRRTGEGPTGSAFSVPVQDRSRTGCGTSSLLRCRATATEHWSRAS